MMTTKATRMMKRSKLTRFRNLLLLAAISMVAIEIFGIDRKYYDSMATIGSEDPALFQVPLATRGLAGRSSSSSSKSKVANEQKPLPLLVLHVGPGATGMAAIKAALAGNREFLFSEDNYIYIGNNDNDDDDVVDLSRPYHCKGKRKIERNIENGERRSDVGSSPEECIPVLSPSLERLLDDNKNNNANMVGSSDVLANPTERERMVWAEQTRNKWDVRIVVSYRRLHELIPETYTTELLHHRIRNHGKYCHEQWPGSNGNCREIPSFLEFLEHQVDLSKHEFVKTYQAWSKNFRVSVFKVHHENENDNENETDLSTNFVCRAMPGADNTCQRLKSRSESNTNSTITGGNNNESSNSNNSNSNSNPVAVSSKDDLLLEFDRLAVRAYEQGLVHEIDNRRELGLAIQKHHDANNNNNNNNNNKWNAERARLMMPLTCPHKNKLDQLYQASLEFESWALALAEPEDNQPNVVTSDFDDSWQETLRHKKLCNLDTSEALKHQEWRTFFRLRYATKTMEHFYGTH